MTFMNGLSSSAAPGSFTAAETLPAPMKFIGLKRWMGSFGVLVSPRMIHFANGVLNYLSVGRWFADRHLRIPVRCAGRQELYTHVAGFVKEPAWYLEFGVFKGGSMRFWTKLLKDPNSALHGFDSFIGLPEVWGLMTGKELFDLKGAVPMFDDSRVRLFKGWFSDSLPRYLREYSPPASLVLHLDADLYSSTACVLKELAPFLKPGAILMFDEFADRDHELKAFTEFLKEHECSLECLGATTALTQVAFRICSPLRSTLHPPA